MNLGCQLSAMRLLDAASHSTVVETMYQASKDFGEGPSAEIGQAPNGFKAKELSKARAAGRRLMGFHLAGREWPASTGTAAYDWLWCTAVMTFLGEDALPELGRWDGFTDMFWHEGALTACQARSAAILVSLLRNTDGGDAAMPPEMWEPDAWIRWRRMPDKHRPTSKVLSKRNYTPAANDVYIGRPSKWGNPYRIGRDGDRASVIRKFRGYLSRQIDTGARGFGINELASLMGRKLVCWCDPLPCHGHVLAAAIEWAWRGALVDEAWWRQARVDEDGHLERAA